jgi:hypothetical protein
VCSDLVTTDCPHQNTAVKRKMSLVTLHACLLRILDELYIFGIEHLYYVLTRHLCVTLQVVERMPIEQQRQLLFFWTSVKYLPADGFGGLSSKLYIYKTSDSTDRLPSSQTCFYRLSLPPYGSFKLMETQVQKIAQEHVSCSFGTW